jgi:hypothetical protein
MTKLYRITILPGQSCGELVMRLNGYAPPHAHAQWECRLTEEQMKELERLYIQQAEPSIEIQPMEPAP